MQSAMPRIFAYSTGMLVYCSVHPIPYQVNKLAASLFCLKKKISVVFFTSGQEFVMLSHFCTCAHILISVRFRASNPERFRKGSMQRDAMLN